MLPAVKVERISSLEINPARGGRGAGFEARVARVEGKLLVARASDVGRSQVVAEGVIEELFAAARSGLRLGYSTIVEDSWLDVASMGEVAFGGSDYYGADLTWIVKTIDEPVFRSSDRRGGFDIGFSSGFGS